LNSNTTDSHHSHRRPRRPARGRSRRGPQSPAPRRASSQAPALEPTLCDTTPVPFTSLNLDHADSVTDPSSLILISDALDELGEVEPNLAEIVDLKFFCGFSFAEIAAMRGVSERTIQRNWEKGRLYLHHAIGRGAPGAPDAHAANQP